jgi:hypothetical protein
VTKGVQEERGTTECSSAGWSSLCILQRILEGEDFERARPVLGDLFHCASETDEEKIRKAWTQLQSVDIFQPLVGKMAKAS